jgi:hypothetical protein
MSAHHSRLGAVGLMLACRAGLCAANSRGQGLQ